jgi:hypothetical protein
MPLHFSTCMSSWFFSVPFSHSIPHINTYSIYLQTFSICKLSSYYFGRHELVNPCFTNLKFRSPPVFYPFVQF